METKTYLVEGMLCKNCQKHVENGIKNISGIKDVIVDINNGQVRIEGENIDSEKIREAIEKSGYIFKGEFTNAPHVSNHWIG